MIFLSSLGVALLAIIGHGFALLQIQFDGAEPRINMTRKVTLRIALAALFVAYVCIALAVRPYLLGSGHAFVTWVLQTFP